MMRGSIAGRPLSARERQMMVGIGWVWKAQQLAGMFAWNYSDPKLAEFFLYRLQFALSEAQLRNQRCRVGISIEPLRVGA